MEKELDTSGSFIKFNVAFLKSKEGLKIDKKYIYIRSPLIHIVVYKGYNESLEKQMFDLILEDKVIGRMYIVPLFAYINIYEYETETKEYNNET